MAQTKQGIQRQKARMIEKYGSEANYKAFMSNIGSVGGKLGKGHAFGHGKVDPSVIGRIGGVNRHKVKP